MTQEVDPHTLARLLQVDSQSDSSSHDLMRVKTARIVGSRFRKIAYKRCCDRLLNLSRSAILTVRHHFQPFLLPCTPRTIRSIASNNKGPTQSVLGKKENPDPDPDRPLSLGIGVYTQYSAAPPPIPNFI